MEQSLNKNCAYAVLDTELNVFVSWFPSISDAVAVIYFQRLLEDFIYSDDATVQSKLKSLRLFKQGVFVEATGKVDYLEMPLLIKDGASFLEEREDV